MESAPTPDPPGVPTRFDALVRSLSWDWLDAISRSLHLEVQLVDTRGSVRLPATAPSQSALARFVVSGTAEMRSLVDAAVSRRAPQTITASNLRIFAYPLTEGDDLLGVALISRPAPGRRASPPQQFDVDPDVATQSILRAIQAHLQGASTAAPRPQFDDLASVSHVLDAAAAHGTDRELVSAFAAALAFWKQIDVYGYVTTASGTYAAEVWPPNAAEPQLAAMVAVADLPSSGTLTALSPAQIQALGIRNARDVLVARVPEGDFPWLMVFCGTIAPADVNRIGLYVRVLEQLIRTVIAESIVKVATAVSAHLLEHADGGESAASGALDILNASIGMSSSALMVTTGYGAPLLHVGPTEPFPRPTDIAAGSRFATLRRVPNRYTFSLVLNSAEGRRITRHQRDVCEAVTNILEAWVRRMLPQLQQRDRRAASKAFDEVLDRFASQALERGSIVSVVVLLISDAACFPGLTQQWIARIRATMRASDIVGMLGEGEIGLLLHDTARDRAEIVALRILKMLETGEGAYTSPVVATGVASRAPDGPGGAGIAEEARNDAISRATGFVQQDSRTEPSNDTH